MAHDADETVAELAVRRPAGFGQEAPVDGYHLSWGAHLLLWVFPVVLTAAAVLFHLRGRRGEDG
jgi:hypothetical protein